MLKGGMKFSRGCPVDREVRWCQEDISTGRYLALPGSWRHDVGEGVEESHASPWGVIPYESTEKNKTIFFLDF